MKFPFYVCERLATSYVLDSDFCDRFLEAIKPRKRLVELEDGTPVPIVRRSSNGEAETVPLPEII